MFSDIIVLHSENFTHQELNYEVLFVNYVIADEDWKAIPILRNKLYSTLSRCFKTDFLHIIRIPNAITFLCFPPRESGNRWEQYGREFTDKIIGIEKKII